MADQKIKIMSLATGTPVDTDWIPFVDVSDTTQSPEGSTKRALKSELEGDTGNGIANISLISTVGLVKTYRITYTDTTTFDYTVTDGTNGTNGTNGIDGESFIWRGAYSGATAYAVNDVVSYNGSSYICILTSTGNLPTNVTYWAIMALKGTDGVGAGDMLASVYDPANGARQVAFSDEVVKTTGNQTISDVKTFSSSPIVPTPTTGTQASNKDYSDSLNPDFYKYSITTSVVSNDLIVTVLNYAGATPSSTAPIKYQDGSGTIRTISSALTITIPDGTNYLNCGSAELATKEVDFFAYFQWNTTTSATNLLIARFPSATFMSDITNSNTNEKGAIGIVNYNSTNRVVNIGRFNATLSAGAGYTWSIPATSVIVNSPIRETRWLDWVPQYSAQGAMTWTSVTTTLAKYAIQGNTLYLQVFADGTTGGVSGNALIATLPINPSTGAIYGGGACADGGGQLGATVFISAANSVQVFKYDQTNYTLGAARRIRLSIFYPV